jgi:cell division protein FtsZ
VGGISNMVISYGENDINVDFNDLRTVMSHQGLALMGMGQDQGENAALNAIKKAIESPLLDNLSIDGAMGVLVHFTLHDDYPLAEIEEGMNIVYDKADEDADIIFGTTTDNSLSPDEIKVTIVATGFEKSKEAKKPVNDIKEEIMQTFTKKIVGGIELDSDALDIPAYIRRMKD